MREKEDEIPAPLEMLNGIPMRAWLAAPPAAVALNHAAVRY